MVSSISGKRLSALVSEAAYLSEFALGAMIGHRLIGGRSEPPWKAHNESGILHLFPRRELKAQYQPDAVEAAVIGMALDWLGRKASTAVPPET